MKAVNLPNAGALPDFDNFPGQIGKYEAVRKMTPFAKSRQHELLRFPPRWE